MVLGEWKMNPIPDLSLQQQSYFQKREAERSSKQKEDTLTLTRQIQFLSLSYSMKVRLPPLVHFCDVLSEG